MRRRLRELGHTVGRFPTGEANSIADVPGVRVGHVTLMEDFPDGRAVRTGVTAVVPHDRDLFREKVRAGAFVLNGYGKTAGLVQVEELGTLEAPILLTNTLSVGAALQGGVEHALERSPEARSVNVVVAECNDAYLNDIRGLHVTPRHARQAIGAASIFVVEGSVGAGTGMSCLGYKGGIGTASRARAGLTVGALVLANFGRAEDLAPHGWLTTDGGTPATPASDAGAAAPGAATSALDPAPATAPTAEPGAGDAPAGSIVAVLAVDAPLDARQLRRLATRGALGVARAGGTAAHGSGDLVLAFSTDRGGPPPPDDSLDDAFTMAIESVHEAILNALCTADRMIGDLRRVRDALPYERLAAGGAIA